MIHNLIQKKNTLTSKMSALWKIKDEEKKEWTREQSQEYERLSDECTKLSKEIEQRSLFLKQSESDKPKAVKKFERETSGITIKNLLRGLIYRNIGNSAFKEDLGKLEEYTREAQHEHGCKFVGKKGSYFPIPPRSFSQKQNFQRDLTTADASGGDLVQDTIETPAIDELYSETWCKKIGCRIEQSSGDNFVVTRVSDPTAQSSEAIAEGSALSERDLTVDEEFKLEPHKLGRIIVATNQWLMQSKDPAIIERALMKEFASFADKQFLTGSGTGANIQGVLNDADLDSVAAGNNGDALTYTKLLAALKEIENNNQVAGTAFVCNPNVKYKAMSVLRAAASGAKFLWENAMLIDKPTAVTTLMVNNLTKGTGMNLSNILLLTPSEVVVCNFGLPAISVSTEGSDWFKEDASAFRIVSYADLGVVRPDKSHALLKDVITEA